MNEQKIKTMLMKLGVSPDLYGYHYLAKCIDIRLKELANGDMQTKWMAIYYQAANEFKTTYTRVERDMRHAIQKTFDKPTELHEQIFGSLADWDSGVVTVSCFIAATVEYFRFEEREGKE